MEGWIKSHRSILIWDWYSDINTKILFIHLLLKANFEEKSWRGILINRGELFTSINHLSIELGISEKQIRNSLKKLKNTNEIYIKGASNGTMITICKYDDYQQIEIKKGKQKGKQTGEQWASDGQAMGEQRATTKEIKNIKELNNIRNKELIFKFESDLFFDNWNVLIEEPKWKKKSISALQKSLDKLHLYSEESSIQMINNSIIGNYQGLFELKNNNQTNNFQIKDNRSNLEKLKATDKRLNELISQLPQ